MRSLFGDGREHPPGTIARIIRLDCDTGPVKIRAAIGRNETSGQFLLCSDDSGQARERPGDSSGQREREQVLIVW